MDPNSLLVLPDDVILDILSFMRRKQQVRLSRTCVTIGCVVEKSLKTSCRLKDKRSRKLSFPEQKVADLELVLMRNPHLGTMRIIVRKAEEVGVVLQLVTRTEQVFMGLWIEFDWSDSILHSGQLAHLMVAKGPNLLALRLSLRRKLGRRSSETHLWRLLIYSCPRLTDFRISYCIRKTSVAVRYHDHVLVLSNFGNSLALLLTLFPKVRRVIINPNDENTETRSTVISDRWMEELQAFAARKRRYCIHVQVGAKGGRKLLSFQHNVRIFRMVIKCRETEGESEEDE